MKHFLLHTLGLGGITRNKPREPKYKNERGKTTRLKIFKHTFRESVESESRGQHLLAVAPTFKSHNSLVISRNISLWG